jgi:hypothetical protein
MTAWDNLGQAGWNVIQLIMAMALAILLLTRS